MVKKAKLKKDAGRRKFKMHMASKDYRHITSRIERAAKIINDGHVRQVDVVDEKEFKHSSLNRAVLANRLGFKIGKVGRRPLLKLDKTKLMKDVMRAESLSGSSMNKSKINSMATNMLNENRDANQPILSVSRTFANSFLRVNSDLSCAKPKKLDIKRMKAACQQVLNPWYDLLQYLHDTHAYVEELIFNIDETSLQLREDWNGAVIFPSDLTPGFKQTPERMANATLVLGIAADGFSIPSVILWPLANVPDELKGLIGHKYFVWANKIGWMNMETSEKYFLTVLLPAIKKRRVSIGNPNARALLLIDSHSSRAIPSVWRKFAAAKVDVLTLTPHVSEIQQPLDCGVNAIFKQSYNSEYEVPNATGIVLQRKSIARALPDSIDKCLLSKGIRNSFLKAGSLTKTGPAVWRKYPVQPILPPVVQSKPPRQYNGFNFFGKVITDKSLLDSWDRFNEAKSNGSQLQKDSDQEESQGSDSEYTDQ